MAKRRSKHIKRARALAQKPHARLVVFVLAAVVLVGGSFAVASGDVIESGDSFIAAVYAAVSGRPIVIIRRDASSPSGVVPMGVPDPLAAYNISVRNVTHFATLNSMPLQVRIFMSQNSPLTLSNITMSYRYCIPPGAFYGYGYRSNGCGSIQVSPSSAYRSGNSYVVTFNSGIPIYPQQSSGIVTIYATPFYTYTGSSTRSPSGNGSLQVRVNGVVAAGDKCQWTYDYYPQSRSYGYGYTSCVSYPAIIGLQSTGNIITVLRPYGYGYNPPRIISQ